MKTIKLESIPDKIIFEEAKKRKEQITAAHGPHSTKMVFRICKGCGQEFSARKMRSHPCTISYTHR